MRPAVSGTSPSTPLRRVDLPAPFGPMSATASPGAIDDVEPAHSPATGVGERDAVEAEHGGVGHAVILAGRRGARKA